MKKHKILIDLKIALNQQYSGIASENRFLFAMLSFSPTLQTHGFLIANHLNSLLTGYKQQVSKLESIEQANQFLHGLLSHELSFKNKILAKLKVAHFLAWQKKRFGLYPIDSVFKDSLWRIIFEKFLPASHREQLLENEFYFSDITESQLKAGSYFKRKMFLETKDHDFALFLEPTAIQVSPKTIKVVRFHDAIPLTEPDLVNSLYSHKQFNVFNSCAKDSYFVCNSEPTFNALIKIKPELEEKSCVIPCVVSSNYKKIENITLLKNILMRRLSSQLIPQEKLANLRLQIQNTDEFFYIFHLATLDPKKNQACLISAWEQLNYQHKEKKPVKLIIAANRGWFSKAVENKMQPHIEAGDIIHLANLGADEIPSLFSHARAFVFPSYIEGFGLPPLEAMQCDCPTIVSDIPTHRYVMGEASLYCDPYNIDSLTQAMEKLIYSADAPHIRETLIQKGRQQVKKYHPDVLQDQWWQLFDRLKAKGK